MKFATRGENPQTALRTELITQLIRKDLKVKYQGSSLGFIWSLANPMLLLIVYTFVFALVFKSRVPQFGFFLMSGMLIWNFFSMGVSGAATSILGNAGLVKKVPFSHSALPLASIGFAGVQVALQYFVLVVALFIGRMGPIRPEVLLIIPALVVAITMTIGLGFFVAASTVKLRDTQHILEVTLFAWMWATPIIYPASLVQEHLHGVLGWVYYLNPMAGVTTAFQRALYGLLYYPPTPEEPHKLLMPSADNLFYLEILGIGFAVSLTVLALGLWQFRRLSADFAEDL